jgi:hypothetical protein
MKNLSIVATVLLIIPIAGVLVAAIQVYKSESTMTGNAFLYINMMRFALSIFVYVLFLIVALILNAKQKYLENSVMCGTLIIAFILFYLVNTAATILVPLLHHNTY